MPEYKISDWFISPGGDAYTAPEVSGIRLNGCCPEKGLRSRIKEGYITTSRIVAVQGRRVTTESGSVYILGAVSKKYRRWLAKEGRTYNPKQPIADFTKKEK